MAGQESGVFGSTPDEWNALGDAQTRWREIATGVGGGGDASNPQPVPDVLSGFIISGGRGFSQDDSGDSFGGLVPAEDAHYYRGFWAGVQAQMNAPFLPVVGNPHPFGYPQPWGGPQPWDERPGVLPELDNPTPDTRVASGAGIVGRVAAVIGRAVVSPAEAGGLDPSRVPYLLQPEGTGGGGIGGGPPPLGGEDFPEPLGYDTPRGITRLIGSSFEPPPSPITDEWVLKTDLIMEQLSMNWRLSPNSGGVYPNVAYPIVNRIDPTQLMGSGTAPNFEITGYRFLDIETFQWGPIQPWPP